MSYWCETLANIKPNYKLFPLCFESAGCICPPLAEEMFGLNRPWTRVNKRNPRLIQQTFSHIVTRFIRVRKLTKQKF